MWPRGAFVGVVVAVGLVRHPAATSAANYLLGEPSFEWEPPAQPMAPRLGEPNRCSDLQQSVSTKGFGCGPPLGQPCFDFMRCTTSPGIYVHDAHCSDGTGIGDEEDDNRYIGWVFRNAAREAGMLAPTYESACVIMHVTTGPTGEGCAEQSPLWNNGSNHVMVDFYDNGSRENRPNVADSYAMDAASNMHSCLYRSGYDVSLPLAPHTRLSSLADIPPLERAFFLTTKGSVYLSGRGSEERMSIVPLHDEVHGVIMSMHCFETHGEHLFPENVEYCESLRATYDDYDYVSLMNTTFGLVPAGRQPSTYRLGEVMGAGVIPVIIARDIVPPFREQFDWSAFSFWFTPDQVASEMLPTLRAVPQAQLEEMQRKSLEAYRNMFGDDDTSGPSSYGPIANLLTDVLSRRLKHLGGR